MIALLDADPNPGRAVTRPEAGRFRAPISVTERARMLSLTAACASRVSQARSRACRGALPRGLGRCALDGGGVCAVQGGAGADGVDLLAGALRRRAERGSVVGDAVAVAVGGDGAGSAPPCRLLFLALRCRAKVGRPRFLIGESATEHGVSAGFDQLATLVQCFCMSSAICPLACGISQTISLGGLRVRPDPADRMVMRATRV